MLKLFRHALHFAMRGDENLVDRRRVEHAFVFRYLLDDSNRFVITKASELIQHVSFLHGLALKCDGIKRTDRI